MSESMDLFLADHSYNVHRVQKVEHDDYNVFVSRGTNEMTRVLQVFRKRPDTI